MDDSGSQSRQTVADSNSGQPQWGWPTTTGMSVVLTGSSFLAGILIGHKLATFYRRILSLVAVGPTKMALVVREDLKMGKGKIAAQCSHGTLLAYQKMTRLNPQVLQSWEDSGQPKVVLRATDLQHLTLLSDMAVAKGVPVTTVYDAGRTQVAKGTSTVLAVGPAKVADVDRITGNLKLL